MNAPSDLQIIRDASGAPAFVVVPYEQFLSQYGQARDLIPNEVVGKIIMDEQHPIRAWREHLGLTQAEVAQRAEMSQAALAQIESGKHKTRVATMEKLADALGLSVAQLDLND
ncbi:helix-turn-helix domain-containing protein [Thiorhodovibrio frisius]|uniref:Putative transcriptional regulator with C-terminal CBS domains n=1 Tax=Thiorhodovibrio frisius TaxID=631362 RepID=H8Z0F1_9GAMM|nr:helix-turn-helix transcriptional regulator [Thiorhodovibrio frisius]EIC21252.1 putative transcriptional regulator with C-terminal CBS domains [Thiorhodovibrio frisius]WPL23828.1 anaerobic benzoate catabolism transcriptional regulator [Thiorhodovibrio frisius]